MTRCLILAVMILATGGAQAQLLDGTFRYQGHLDVSGTPYTGLADISVTMYDALVGGSPVGQRRTKNGVSVTDGVFNLELDMDVTSFKGQQLWLGISVRVPAGAAGGFTTLSPRQPVLGTPQAIQTRGLFIDPSLRVGIGTNTPGELLEVVGDTELAAVFGDNTRATDETSGVMGQSASDSGRGIYGYATNGAGFNFGVYGRSDSADGTGVFGSADAASGTTYGVYGQAISQDGTGVYGLHNTAAGTGPGLVGETRSAGPGATGLLGLVSSATNGSTSAGVLGENRGDRDDSYGVHGKHLGDGIGVFGTTTGPASDGTGVMGQSTSGIGVYGRTLSASAVNYGVRGRTVSPSGIGVRGEANAGGFAGGVLGKAISTSGRGLSGWSTANTGNGIGVFGESSSADGWGGYFLGRGYFSDRLGLGTTNALASVHVRGGTDAGPFGGGHIQTGEFTSTNIVIDNNEILARDWISPGTLFLQHNGGHVEMGRDDDVEGLRLVVEGYALSHGGTTEPIAVFNHSTPAPNAFSFHWLIVFGFNNGFSGIITISESGVNYGGFTGGHYARAGETLEPWSLVVMTGDNDPMFDVPGSEPVYGVALSRTPNSPRTLGAYRGPSEHETAPVNSAVASVGNGAMWVTDDGRQDLEPGDYLISSGVDGCAMLDDPGRFAVGHVVAQAGERVDWSTVRRDADGHRRALITVQYERFNRQGDGAGTARELARIGAEVESRSTRSEQQGAELDAIRDQIRALRARMEEPARAGNG